MASKEKIKLSKSADRSDIEMRSKAHPRSQATTSKNTRRIVVDSSKEPPTPPWTTTCCRYLYNRERKTFCDRTCKSWWYMITYSIMYLIFLSTFTMIFLYVTLLVVKVTEIYNIIDKSELIAYRATGIGLTASPTSSHNFPVIAYTDGQSDEYSKYVTSLDELFKKRRKRQVSNLPDLGPCGTPPYGYGDKPCVIIRLNKQLNWSAKPISANTTNDLPKEVRSWLKLKEQKLWLYCSGYYPYDKEHIGSINYYPYPPGFDPGVFPLDMQSDAPLIGVQISNFTKGISLSVECKLWYDSGVSSLEFLLYIEPKNRSIRTGKA